MIRTELFFGFARSDGSEISLDEWDAFVREEMTPRFAAGLTIIEARGQWRDRRGAIHREPARIVVILYEPSDSIAQRIEQLRALYQQRFRQESVIRVDSVERVSF